MFLNPPPFPDDLVGLYPQIADEPEFRPVDHLALESGGDRIGLDALGYLPEDLNGLPTDCAAVGPFRVLSPAGVEALRTVALAFRKLDPATEDDPKAGYQKPRGLAYSSRFVRSMCADRDLAVFLSRQAGTPLAHHGALTLPTIVYAPTSIERSNQGWHLDTVGFACVISLNDPDTLDGGRFQYFKGTKQAVANRLGVDPRDLRRSVGHITELPTDQVETVRYPAAGWGMLMQGQMVVHRGEPLNAPAERMVLVTALMSLNPLIPDPTYWSEIETWNSPAVSEERRRHEIWRRNSSE